MGDLAVDTEVMATGEGRFIAAVSPEWEIWGPMGGYVASIALRAAGAASPFDRPASFSCHYLEVAAFGPVELVVTTQRAARTALSQRVEMIQGKRKILSAEVWSVGEVEGLEHHLPDVPEVPGPDGLPSMEELAPGWEPWFPFWGNLDSRPLSFDSEWPPPRPHIPAWQSWLRFRPTPTFADPWVDAARSVVLLDLVGWPSANRHYAWREPAYIAPSLDLYVAFHDPSPADEWLLADGYAPVAGDGLLGWHGRLWSPGRGLVASGGGQALFRRTRTAPSS